MLTDNLILASQKILREQSTVAGFILGFFYHEGELYPNTARWLWALVYCKHHIGDQASTEVFIYDTACCTLWVVMGENKWWLFWQVQRKRLVSK